MAPNTNLKAVALFGCSPKDLELIIGNNDAKQQQQASSSSEASNVLTSNAAVVVDSSSLVLLNSSSSRDREGLVTPAPSFDDRCNTDVNQQAIGTKQETHSGKSKYDSDKYWEDVADSDTLWHYHGVTAHRMEARRVALARVLNRLEEKKAFEKEASSKTSLFNANAIVDNLVKDAASRHKTAEEEHSQESDTPHDDHFYGYWDEKSEEEQQQQMNFHGRVALPETDSHDYWTMNNNDSDVVDDEQEDDTPKQETVAAKEHRHCTTLRIQEEVRLLSRLNDFRQQQQSQQNDDMFSVDHMIELERIGMLKKNTTVVGGVPVGGVGGDYWDW